MKQIQLHEDEEIEMLPTSSTTYRDRAILRKESPEELRCWQLQVCVIFICVVIMIGVGLVVMKEAPTQRYHHVLSKAVTGENIMKHLRALQAIATGLTLTRTLTCTLTRTLTLTPKAIAMEHNGTRAAGTSGYHASLQYVEDQLAPMIRNHGWKIHRQPFSMTTRS